MSFNVLTIRLSKIVLAGGLALFSLLAMLNNITDYGSNWDSLRHVLAMETVFPESTLRWRAVTSPTIQMLAYWSIISAQGLMGLAFLVATWEMAWKLTSPKADFRRAKALTALGILLGVGLWFIGFMTIAGEWFVMWQSERNVRESAFQFFVATLAAGIYVFLDTDGDID